MTIPQFTSLKLTSAAESGSWASGSESGSYGDVYTSEVFNARIYGTAVRSAKSSPNAQNTLQLIKKSIRQIKAEAVGEDAQKAVQTKIDRLRELGVTKQAEILELELQVRVKLCRIEEWKQYKVLPYDAIKQYEADGRNWDGKGGRLIVHIDPLDKYCGTLTETEAKDKIIPDEVLDNLETAKDRQLFDEFAVLWVEKVKDPLLLGKINGCKDFFFICEWGEDVTFKQVMKDK